MSASRFVIPAFALATLALAGAEARAAEGMIGRCEQAEALLVDVTVNEGAYSERAMKNLGRVTQSTLDLVSKELGRGTVTQVLSLYGEEGEATFCLSSCAHGIGSGLERDLSAGLQNLGKSLAKLSRPGVGFVSVKVEKVAHFSDCTRGTAALPGEE